MIRDGALTQVQGGPASSVAQGTRLLADPRTLAAPGSQYKPLARPRFAGSLLISCILSVSIGPGVPPTPSISLCRLWLITHDNHMSLRSSLGGNGRHGSVTAIDCAEQG